MNAATKITAAPDLAAIESQLRAEQSVAPKAVTAAFDAGAVEQEQRRSLAWNYGRAPE